MRAQGACKRDRDGRSLDWVAKCAPFGVECDQMGTEGGLRVRWTRAELVAVREAIEITPLFEGRADVRLTIRKALRANRREVVLDPVQAERLASHLVPVDMATAIAKVKLLRAVREAGRVEVPAQAGRAA